MEERGICQWQVPFCMGTRGKDSKDFVILTKRGYQIWQKVNIA